MRGYTSRVMLREGRLANVVLQPLLQQAWAVPILPPPAQEPPLGFHQGWNRSLKPGTGTLSLRPIYLPSAQISIFHERFFPVPRQFRSLQCSHDTLEPHEQAVTPASGMRKGELGRGVHSRLDWRSRV